MLCCVIFLIYLHLFIYFSVIFLIYLDIVV